LALWALRRRSGVPAGAVQVSYHREESFVVGLWTFAMVVETIMLEILLRGIGCPDWLRIPILVLDVYGVVIVIAVRAACVTRPHVITAGELRVRYAAYFDLRVPRERITSVRLVRNRDEQGLIRVQDGTAAVAVTSQTNIVVELDEPITVVRPLGKRAEARTIRFFADSPEIALTSLKATPEPAAQS
ncbi:hypothetical protein ACFQ07_19130, partial [Actinomadura adrarensis]